MEIATTCTSISNLTRQWQKDGHTVGLVPTMGFLHDGHLALVRMAKEKADRVVVSIFVNPMQFGPQEDLAAYPRDLDRDSDLLAQEKVDALFAPDVVEIYPEGFQTTVSVSEVSQGLCGSDRPGHFNGVCTVVAKLFNLVRPDCAIFGEKDFQQLTVIRQMVKDLQMGIDVLGHPIVREPDGLAMSSRNVYLDEQERQSALCLSKAIMLAREEVRQGKLVTEQLSAAITKFLASFDDVSTEYVSFVDQENLKPVASVDANTVLALAVKINKRVRLIDNGFVLEKR